ncbi:hypothetical protein [Actinocatenispora rupis]|uniref:Uncharacterized protein n=1 Tax=Actinocatenispora rupis TaxID=519421 RepID=A0A8J3J250_9ACTN|nr:hypothetical protein [Actinocatenispora rupis]GID12788.1 hypothetical protein Aru02nite_36770 [Actinocatenispora rupis]
MSEIGDPTPRDRYRRAVAALAEPLHDRVAGHDRADQALLAGRREIAARVADSATLVRASDEDVARARAGVRETDDEAARIWRELRAFAGRRGELGPPPPALAPEPNRPAYPAELLAHADRTVARARRGELRMPPPLPIWLAMLAAGLLGALILAGVGRALLVAAHGMPTGERSATRIVAEIAFFAAPVAGIPLALAWLSRYGQPMTPRGFAVVLGTGIVVGCGLFGLLAH